MSENQVVLYDGHNPVGRVKFVDNLRESNKIYMTSTTVGVAKLSDGNFYICTEGHFDKRRAELISETEARYHAAKNLNVFAEFFGELPELN